MLITTLQEEAINECLRRNIPFVIYALPSEGTARFMASLPNPDGTSHAFMDPRIQGECFFISRFASDEPYLSGVLNDMDEGTIIDWLAANPTAVFDSCDELPHLTSTRRVSYDEAFKAMTRRLKKDGGKVVLSRHKSIFTTDRLLPVVSRYFDACPGAFRYLSFTPETGVWLGATPELLLETERQSDTIHTMALAGTLPADASGGWDSKNLAEHEVVVKFITEILSSHGLEVHTDAPTELKASNVTHLCSHITAKGTIKNVGAIINDLNPTPAVAGWPRQLAIAEIDALETHQRRCYSGIVGIIDERGLHAYVNLRCAFLAPVTYDGRHGWLYNIYAGGGLMPDSILENEWTETSRKMETFISCLTDITENPIEAQF